MANGLIGKVTAGGGTHLIASTAYFTCATAGGTAEKIAKAADTSLNSLTIITGMTIYVKFDAANTKASPTLTLQTNGGIELLAAKPIMRYGTTATYQNAAGSWKSGAVVALTYDGTNWVEVSSLDDNSTYYYTSCYVSTAAGTAAKVGACSNYALQEGYLQVLLMNANTSQSALTLNINSTGAKPIYINGTASSASNYILPKAMYLVYYDGTNFYFRTDGALTATGSGAAYSTAANGALTFGALPIAQGGTGKTTAAAAWTALGGGASGKHADSYFALASHGLHVPETGTSNNNKFLKAGSTAGSLSWATVASVSDEVLTIVS